MSVTITAIRKWLLGTGRYFGCTEVHPYRWSDASSRPHVPYITFRPVNAKPELAYGVTRAVRPDDTDANKTYTYYAQSWESVWQIDLYNVEDGLERLAGCAIAMSDQRYLDSLQEAGIGNQVVEQIVDETDYDDAEILYHHTMSIRLNTPQSCRIDEATNVIDSATFTTTLT